MPCSDDTTGERMLDHAGSKPGLTIGAVLYVFVGF